MISRIPICTKFVILTVFIIQFVSISGLGTQITNLEVSHRNVNTYALLSEKSH